MESAATTLFSASNSDSFAVSCRAEQPKYRNAEGRRVQCNSCAIWTLRETWEVHLGRCPGPPAVEPALARQQTSLRTEHRPSPPAKEPSRFAGKTRPHQSNSIASRVSINSSTSSRSSFGSANTELISTSQFGFGSTSATTSAPPTIKSDDKLASFARRFIMLADPHVTPADGSSGGKIEPRQVFCATCSRWVKLSSAYGLSLWKTHCRTVHGRDHATQNKLVQQALAVAKNDIDAELQRLRRDPRVRGLRGHEAQCNGCGGWTTSFELHKCPRSSVASVTKKSTRDSTESATQPDEIVASLPRPDIVDTPNSISDAVSPTPSGGFTAPTPASSFSASTGTGTIAAKPSKDATAKFNPGDQLGAFARRVVLEADTLIDQIEELRVHCRECSRWIVLHSPYTLSNWWGHCRSIHKRDVATQTKIIEDAVAGAADEIAADDARLQADPRVRQVQGPRVQCDDCGRWTSAWDSHRCPVRPQTTTSKVPKGTNLSTSESTRLPQKRSSDTFDADPHDAVKRARSADAESELSDVSIAL